MLRDNRSFLPPRSKDMTYVNQDELDEATLLSSTPRFRLRMDKLTEQLNVSFECADILEIYSSVSDEMRYIRTEMRMQRSKNEKALKNNVDGENKKALKMKETMENEEAVEVLEQMVKFQPYHFLVSQILTFLYVGLNTLQIRFHIMMMHELCDAPLTSGFNPHMNVDYLNKIFRDLMPLYKKLRDCHRPQPNEGELRAYYMLLGLDEDSNFQLPQSPSTIDLPPITEDFWNENKEIVLAFHLLHQFNSKDIGGKCLQNIQNANYLQACILQASFFAVRTKVLESVQKCMSKQEKYPFPDLAERLSIEPERLKPFLKHHGVTEFTMEDSVECMMKQTPFRINTKPMDGWKSQFTIQRRGTGTLRDEIMKRPDFKITTGSLELREATRLDKVASDEAIKKELESITKEEVELNKKLESEVEPDPLLLAKVENLQLAKKLKEAEKDASTYFDKYTQCLREKVFESLEKSVREKKRNRGMLAELESEEKEWLESVGSKREKIVKQEEREKKGGEKIKQEKRRRDEEEFEEEGGTREGVEREKRAKRERGESEKRKDREELEGRKFEEELINFAHSLDPLKGEKLGKDLSSAYRSIVIKKLRGFRTTPYTKNQDKKESKTSLTKDNTSQSNSLGAVTINPDLQRLNLSNILMESVSSNNTSHSVLWKLAVCSRMHDWFHVGENEDHRNGDKILGDLLYFTLGSEANPTEMAGPQFSFLMSAKTEEKEESKKGGKIVVSHQIEDLGFDDQKLAEPEKLEGSSGVVFVLNNNEPLSDEVNRLKSLTDGLSSSTPVPLLVVWATEANTGEQPVPEPFQPNWSLSDVSDSSWKSTMDLIVRTLLTSIDRSKYCASSGLVLKDYSSAHFAEISRGSISTGSVMEMLQLSMDWMVRKRPITPSQCPPHSENIAAVETTQTETTEAESVETKPTKPTKATRADKGVKEECPRAKFFGPTPFGNPFRCSKARKCKICVPIDYFAI